MTLMSPHPASPKEHEEKEEMEQAPSKTSYAVKLLKFDVAKKVTLIKEIKNILPDMNLVQAKKFVEVSLREIFQSSPHTTGTLIMPEAAV